MTKPGFQYDIEGIKDGLRECVRMASGDALQDLRTSLEKAVEAVDEPLQLALIGKISSSKSTLVNAILGKENLMITGQGEVTGNVGWLKYGDPDSNVIIHYKDSLTPRTYPRQDLNRILSSSGIPETGNISFIEIFDDAPILKEINIIDTPGLDATRKQDSLNTLDFISKVKPDAVLLLYTHSVAESVLNVLQRFNSEAAINPLNSLGVLAKIDLLWQESIPRGKSALSIGKRMAESKKARDKVLADTLFDIYPLSALLYLGATSVTQEDIDLIRQEYDSDPEEFMRSLNSVRKFLSSPALFPAAKREELLGKIGLYGIYLVARELESGNDIALSSVKKLFLRESGAEEFRRSLSNHFGNRAKLIKLESIWHGLHAGIWKIRSGPTKSRTLDILTIIEQKLSDLFSTFVHEHKEYQLLKSLYEGDLWLDEETASELRHLCGENGWSAPARLGMPGGTEVDELLAHALERERHWRKISALEPDPDEREWMKVMQHGYGRLRSDISAAKYQFELAGDFLFDDRLPAP